jgi:hypothetical protein
MRVVLIVAACACFVVAIVAVRTMHGGDTQLAIALTAAVIGIVLAGLIPVFKRHNH